MTGFMDIFRIYSRFVLSELDYGWWQMELFYWNKLFKACSKVFTSMGFEYWTNNSVCIRTRTRQFFLPLNSTNSTSNCSEIDPILWSLSEEKLGTGTNILSLILPILLCIFIVLAMKLIINEFAKYKHYRGILRDNSIKSIAMTSSSSSEDKQLEERLQGAYFNGNSAYAYFSSNTSS
ncbi:unnamed protein product [Moneuplotes crassus]|uniref:Uncharacterized protein n=1 Tax=Euplotes crassus TaxID=5936 RepID=A0AAD2CY18_EUPCR|nr:unnamed protein product [Moneuplotes crassus]